MSDLQSQATRLFNDLQTAVEVDPKAPAGAATRSLLQKIAAHAKEEARDKRAATMVFDAINETTSVAMSVADALALAGQLMRALSTREV